MTEALKAHVRILESIPKERIKTHEQRLAPEPLPGRIRPLTDEMIETYKKMKKAGERICDIRAALKTSTAMMRTLKKVAG